MTRGENRETFRRKIEEGNKQREALNRQAQRLADIRFTEMMSSAGVNPDRMALELLYLMPRDFRNAYIALFDRALTGADGGAGKRGAANAESGTLMKGKTAVRGGGGKKYKRYWVVKDEKALEFKSKIDKRLRALAREIKLVLEGKTEAEKSATRCGSCNRFMDPDWRHCPHDGFLIEKASGIGDHDDEKSID